MIDHTETAQRQSRIPLRKAVRIAWKNLRVRWWRSLLVTSGIILALAFLTYILNSDALASSAAQNGSADLIEELRYRGVLANLSNSDAKIQTRWMVGLALVISFVGILNAMVMSVTERFREIGTMKCLGALDSLIIKLYLLESLFQGMAGTLLGIAIGLTLAMLEGFSLYGSELMAITPMTIMARQVALCFFSGIILTMGGALYPAWVAAKMDPIVAMRSEV